MNRLGFDCLVNPRLSNQQHNPEIHLRDITTSVQHDTVEIRKVICR